MVQSFNVNAECHSASCAALQRIFLAKNEDLCGAPRNGETAVRVQKQRAGDRAAQRVCGSGPAAVNKWPPARPPATPPAAESVSFVMMRIRGGGGCDCVQFVVRTPPPISQLNPLKPELNPICYLLALLGAHHFLHVSRIRVKLLTLR